MLEAVHAIVGGLLGYFVSSLLVYLYYLLRCMRLSWEVEGLLNLLSLKIMLEGDEK